MPRAIDFAVAIDPMNRQIGYKTITSPLREPALENFNAGATISVLVIETTLVALKDVLDGTTPILTGNLIDTIQTTDGFLPQVAFVGRPEIPIVLSTRLQIDATSFFASVAYFSDCSMATLYPGDVNLDGKVDSFDLDIVAINWQQTVPPNFLGRMFGDLNGSGLVESGDLNLIGVNWQTDLGLPKRNCD